MDHYGRDTTPDTAVQTNSTNWYNDSSDKTLDVGMPGVLREVFVRHGGTDAVGLDAFRAELRHVGARRQHAR